MKLPSHFHCGCFQSIHLASVLPIFSLNIQRGCGQLIELEKLTVGMLTDQEQARSLLCGVFVSYAFRMPGVRRMPGMLLTAVKPVVRCMMYYLEQYANHHLKTSGKATFNVNNYGWAEVYDFFGNACATVLNMEY